MVRVRAATDDAYNVVEGVSIMTARPPTQPPPLPEHVTRQMAPDSRIELDDVLTGKNLFRLGLGLLLLGFVFLFRHAIQENWIGPGARVAAGAITSAVLVGAGLQVGGRRPTYGQLLQGGGVAGLYLTAFASHRVYGMIDETSALLQLALISLIGVGLAVRAGAELLATVSVVGALAAPLLIGGRMLTEGGDSLYVAVVLAATVGLYLRFEWTRLWFVAQGCALLVVLADLVRLKLDWPNAPTAWEVQLVLAAIWVAFYLVPVAAARAGHMSDVLPGQVGTAVITLVTMAMSYAAWSGTVDEGVLAGAAATAALVYLGAWYVLSPARIGQLAELQLLPAAVAAGAAAVLAFDGPVLSLLLAGEAAAVVIVARRASKAPVEWIGHAWFAALALREAVDATLDPAVGTALINGPALSRLGMLGLAGGLAVFLSRSSDDVAALLGKAYGGFAYLGLAALLADELAQISQGAVTAGWGAVGVAATVAGTAVGRRAFRLIGSGTLLVAVGKLFMVDLASVDPIWRIMLFSGFGVALLVVGYWMSNDE